MKRKTLFTCYAAIIAAMYVVLSLISTAFGMSSGVIQCRLSEALCILPVFTPAAVPGVCIKCQACVKACPHGAKSWQDAAFLSHQAALQREFQDRKEAVFYPPLR